MSDDHDHDHEHHDDPHQEPLGLKATPPVAPSEDSGSQALSEALSSSFFVVKVGMVLLAVVFVASGFFKVGASEKAVVLHFGKPEGAGDKALLGPGLHFALPYPIDEVRRIPYSQLMQVKSTVGWFRTTPEMEALNQDGPPTASLNPAQDGYVVTADGNIIHTRATLIYHIVEPIHYEFDFINASNTVQNLLDNALLATAARFKVDDILTRDIVRFQDAVKERVIELAQQQNLGIMVEQCQVESRPPIGLKAAFDSVLTALSMREKTHNDALSFQNQVLSRAEAEAAGRTNSAQAERVSLVESVKADAQQFKSLLPQYQTNAALFANVLLNEKIGQVLTNVEDKIYLPERADGKTRELRLQLSREPAAPPTAKPPGGPLP